MIKLSPLSLGPTDPKITPDEFVHGTVLREEEKAFIDAWPQK